MSSFMLGSPYAGPSSGRNQGQDEVVPGQYCSVKRDGEDWPVVICDEETVQKYFVRNHRPTSARQADGTWGADYKAGGSRADMRSCPVLIPGTLQLFWPVIKDLEPLDTGLGEVIQETTSNQQLAKAWSEAIRNEKADTSIDHWKQRLANGGDISEIRKRKGTPNFKIPLGYAREEVDDDEGADTFLQLEKDDKPKIKKESSDSISSSELDVLWDEDFIPCSPHTAPSSKRSRLNLAGRCSTQARTPVDGGNQAGSANVTSARARSASIRSAVRTDTVDQSKVTIYVGNPHTKFICKRSSLGASPYLSSHEVYHPQHGWYVMSPMLSNLPAGKFRPVAEYLERGEYDPNLLGEDTDWVRLEYKQVMSERQRAEELIRCGEIYSIARDLELPGLQNLAFRKLKALGKQGAHQASAILSVVEMVFGIGKEDIREYLLEYLAVHYWTIMKVAVEKASQVMQNDDELARRVFGLLSGSVRTDTDDQDSRQVKNEMEEELPVAVGSSGSSGENFQGDRLCERVISEADQGMIEMVKVAMRESDEQMTEEEITETMLEQSQFPRP